MNAKTRFLGKLLLTEGILSIRDVDAGEQPFLYSSGHSGPGYVMVKGLVGKKELLKHLVQELAREVATRVPRLNFVAGNATGGMIPGWLLANDLEELLKRGIPYVYVRGSRKKGGHRELITGIENNETIRPADNGLVVEELVNFAETTCNSAFALREAGFNVTDAACILFYDNPNSRQALSDAAVRITYLITLPELLDLAEEFKTHSSKAITSYRDFIQNPIDWQKSHGITRE